MSADVKLSAYVTALRRERAGYLAQGRPERAADVEAELGRMGATTPSTAAPASAPGAPETTEASRLPERAVPSKPRPPRR